MYYPDQRYASQMTVIRRECLLPSEAYGSLRVKVGDRVDVRDVVATGAIPAPYVVLDAVRFFKLRHAGQLNDLLRVENGEHITEGQVLAGKNPTRGKRLLSPVDGYVAHIGEGRIILQASPQTISLEAGVRGRVAHIDDGRGVVIESIGAHVQGVWGNNQRAIATLQVEPEEGITNLKASALEARYSGTVMLVRGPLTADLIQVIMDKDFAGVIAPSTDAALLEPLYEIETAVILTEGFGAMRMSASIYKMLSDFAGHQITVDAVMPGRWEKRYPEVIINLAARDEERPSRPSGLLALRSGMHVRITRDPHLGASGRVSDIPKSPVLLPNGLRILCAQVELMAGEKIFVPLANLEVLDR